MSRGWHGESARHAAARRGGRGSGFMRSKGYMRKKKVEGFLKKFRVKEMGGTFRSRTRRGWK